MKFLQEVNPPKDYLLHKTINDYMIKLLNKAELGLHRPVLHYRPEGAAPHPTQRGGGGAGDRGGAP